MAYLHFSVPAFKPDGRTPLDWDREITARGVSRNNVFKRYLVRVSAGGKQNSVGVAYSQDDAALLYDLAVWKLCPKMGRKPVFNDAERARDITQEVVDREAGFLNRLYDKLPFLDGRDVTVAEDVLRSRAMTLENQRAGRVGCFDGYVNRVRFFRGLLAVESSRLEVGRLKLKAFHKLAGAAGLVELVKKDVEVLSGRLKQLEESLEGQVEYYKKVEKEYEE